MGPVTQSLTLYRELAEWYERLGQTTMRDRFLMLAADAAMQLGQSDEADRLRLRLLQGSRHHMLRPYSSWAEAAASPDVQAYLRDLRLNYPQETAEKLLAGLKQGQGGAAPAQPAAPAKKDPPSRPIPYTAPLVDINGPADAPQPQARPRPRMTAPLGETYPIADERQAVPPPKAAPPRQARPVARAALPVEEKRRPEKGPANGASWMSMALMVLMALVALAAAAWSLGRPFLPQSWLR